MSARYGMLQAMAVYVGTSGFSYAEWKGTFYPPALPSRRMLEHYAGRLPSVELNNTFYRMPTASALEGWRAAVPESFRFAVKAPRVITHQARLAGADAALERFVSLLSALGAALGPVLFQLPPTQRADLPRLRDFTRLLPEGLRAAFEFRHPSWFADEVLALLEEAGCALVGGDLDDAERAPPLVRTAPFAYLRLRKSDYTAGELESWSKAVQGLGVADSYVFLKHDPGAPARALRLLELTGGA